MRIAPKRKKHVAVDPSLRVLTDQAVFAQAVALLSEIDPPFVRRILVEGQIPLLRRRPAGFAGLAGIVVAQQVSTASADAIFGRLEACLNVLDASRFAAATDEDLRRCGLSGPKLRTLRAISMAVLSGRLDLAGLERLEADVAHATLTEISGIGPWTADIYLLFCLGHADAWPTGDLALQEGARLALDLMVRPTAKDLAALGDRWRPLRGVAAHCLWAYYGAVARPSPAAGTPAGARTGRRKRTT